MGCTIDRKESSSAALMEARSIVHAMKSGVAFNDVFTVTPQTRRVLQKFCDQNPNDAYFVENALAYRAKVQEHVDRLIKEGDVVVTKVEEAVSSAGAEDSETFGALSVEEEPTTEEDEASEAFDPYEW